MPAQPDTEDLRGEVAFPLELELKKDAPAGARKSHVSCALSDPTQNVRALKVDGTATLTGPRSRAGRPGVPAGYARGADAPSSRFSVPARVGSVMLVAFDSARIFAPCVFR
jgi:hypothetical protein